MGSGCRLLGVAMQGRNGSRAMPGLAVGPLRPDPAPADFLLDSEQKRKCYGLAGGSVAVLRRQRLTDPGDRGAAFGPECARPPPFGADHDPDPGSASMGTTIV